MCKHGTKTTSVFLPADIFKCLLVATSKFGLLTIRWHSAIRKNLFPYPQGDKSGLRKPKRGQASILITATTRIHLPKPVSTDLTIKPDSVLANPIGKDGVQSWLMIVYNDNYMIIFKNTFLNSQIYGKLVTCDFLFISLQRKEFFQVFVDASLLV